MAKAYAMATKALEKVDEVVNSEFEQIQLAFPLTKIIKISNLIDDEQAQFYQQTNFDDIRSDLVKEITKIQEIKFSIIVGDQPEFIGAKKGDLFVELTNSMAALDVIKKMEDQKYEGRQIKIVCVPIEAYIGYFLLNLKKSKI